ncbi:MAG: hypothetical protein FWH21_03070 [Kiritimatiellaeota bacterium]|nr:hypothetical protein [Kiritimatiellota bacterium]
MGESNGFTIYGYFGIWLDMSEVTGNPPQEPYPPFDWRWLPLKNPDNKAKLWKGIIGFVGGGLVFVLLFSASQFVAIYMSTNPARRILYSPKTYVPVGETLALYCQSYPRLQSLFETEHDIVNSH